MTSYLVGKRLILTVSVKDSDTLALIDPGTFVFRLKPPTGSGYTAGLYSWNGTVWTNSENTLAVPAKGSAGIFKLKITIPYSNLAKGTWFAGWKSTENGSALAEGSGEQFFIVNATGAL